MRGDPGRGRSSNYSYDTSTPVCFFMLESIRDSKRVIAWYKPRTEIGAKEIAPQRVDLPCHSLVRHDSGPRHQPNNRVVALDRVVRLDHAEAVPHEIIELHGGTSISTSA